MQQKCCRDEGICVVDMSLSLWETHAFLEWHWEEREIALETHVGKLQNAMNPIIMEKGSCQMTLLSKSYLWIKFLSGLTSQIYCNQISKTFALL